MLTGRCRNAIVFSSLMAISATAGNVSAYQPRLSDIWERYLNSPIPPKQNQGGSAIPPSPQQLSSQPPQKEVLPKTKHQSKRLQPLYASWEGGKCKFENNVLTYYVGKKKAGVKLDVEVSDAKRMLCGDEYSVLLTPHSAVVTLGANYVFDGILSLGGYINGQFVWANSYSLKLPKQASEPIGNFSLGKNCAVTEEEVENGAIIKKELVLDHCLRVQTAAGNIWTINLFAPTVWYL